MLKNIGSACILSFLLEDEIEIISFQEVMERVLT